MATQTETEEVQELRKTIKDKHDEILALQQNIQNLEELDCFD